ncbi:MAG: HNH endonuclease [Candidatus Parabeggiatoa sp.]|nr:HNH endonuclease [Candidatus Parabeggiatoa sp.]
MRSVKKDFDNPSEILQSEGCHQKIQHALHEKNKHHFSPYYYGHPDKVRQDLEELYFGKCVYCETKVIGGVLRIDHYRPKNKIKEEHAHTGYYWLGYEWSNLFPACEKCNRAKSNAFPLEVTGIRVTKPPLDSHGELDKYACRADSPSLLAEKPLLLNPEIDKPQEHFVFLPNGEIKALTEKAQKTAEICNLNRDDLVFARKTIVDSFLKKIKRLADDFIEGIVDQKTLHYSLKLLFLDLLTAQAPEQTYSQLGWFMFKKFELFFVKRLGIKQQKVVWKAFQFFNNGKL